MRAFQQAILLAGVLPGLALADSGTPTVAAMKKVFSPDNQPLLCQGGSVDAGALLGQLHIVYDLNPYAMPGRHGPDGKEVVPAALRSLDWMLLVNSDDLVDSIPRAELGVQHQRLVNVGSNLAFELKRLQEAEADAPFQLTTGGVPVSLDTEPQRNRALRRLFAPLLGTSELEPLTIRCLVKIAEVPAKGEQADDEKTKFVLSVRGKHEDLVVSRPTEKTGYEADLYKLASGATLAFTDNHESRLETTKAEAALGVSRPMGRIGYGTAFVHYLANSTETGPGGDDDDSKDTNALSYGLMYRRDFEWGKDLALVGAFSASAFETVDHAQDSKLVRGRVSFSDLSLSRLERRALCGGDGGTKLFWYQCRFGLFAEYGRVQDVGRSVDYQTLEDDSYAGVGLDFGFAIALEDPAVVAPLTLTLNYRYLGIVSSDLDPEWWSAKLSYDFPQSNVSIGLFYEKGENAVTFEDVEITTFNIGFKY